MQSNTPDRDWTLTPTAHSVVPREPRALVFLTAGARAVPVSTFLQYDILGGALWVPAMLIVGHGFGTQIGDLDHAVGWLNRSTGWATGIGALLLVIWLSWGREESKL